MRLYKTRLYYNITHLHSQLAFFRASLDCSYHPGICSKLFLFHFETIYAPLCPTLPLNYFLLFKVTSLELPRWVKTLGI